MTVIFCACQRINEVASVCYSNGQLSVAPPVPNLTDITLSFFNELKIIHK